MILPQVTKLRVLLPFTKIILNSIDLANPDYLNIQSETFKQNIVKTLFLFNVPVRVIVIQGMGCHKNLVKSPLWCIYIADVQNLLISFLDHRDIFTALVSFVTALVSFVTSVKFVGSPEGQVSQAPCLWKSEGALPVRKYKNCNEQGPWRCFWSWAPSLKNCCCL